MSRLVTVVDDDESVRESLPDLLRSFGLEVEAFSSAEAFLGSEALARTACLILDVAMPGMTGPELHQELVRRKAGIPIIFITAYADHRIRPAFPGRRMVVARLIKPFSEAALLEAVNAAFGKANG
ncbi:MAG: todT 3 [Brevundimonas sp.]|nr:todT 3 [Brevundimonas sp.]